MFSVTMNSMKKEKKKKNIKKEKDNILNERVAQKMERNHGENMKVKLGTYTVYPTIIEQIKLMNGKGKRKT